MRQTLERQAPYRQTNTRLPLRTVSEKFSSIEKLTSEHRRQMASKTITDRSAAARQVYRFRAHLLENDAQSKKLAVIDDVDPGHEYLKALGWDEVPDGKVEEGWRKTWDDHKDGVGNFGTWMNVHFKRWREQWVKLDEEAARRTEAQSASDAEVPQLDADPVLGQEFPTLAAAAVDIEQQTSPPAAEVAAEQIVAQGLSHGQDGAETRQAFMSQHHRPSTTSRRMPENEAYDARIDVAVL
nr:uncharacterized protein CTRU02_15212 [Colletotrichum truncatum]KAF6781322.1 hypothetical protein CTRU02_15212 [Colletotrichum truncatum]